MRFLTATILTLAVVSPPVASSHETTVSSSNALNYTTQETVISAIKRMPACSDGRDVIHANWAQDTGEMYVLVEAPEGPAWLTIAGFVANAPLQCADGYCEYEALIKPKKDGLNPHQVEVIVHSHGAICRVGIH